MKRAASRFVDVDGVRIHAHVVPGGRRETQPVVVLHGFTGSIESMRDVVTELCAQHTVVAIDLVGHGASDAPEQVDAYTMPACVEQIAQVLDALALERPHLLGYSMGGRAALSFVAKHPDRVGGALLIGANAGLPEPEARAARLREDQALADRIVEGGTDGLPDFVDAWMAKPLFASQARLGEIALERARKQRLDNRPLGLANSLRGMGTGAMPVVDLEAIERPLCFVVGAEDAKFEALARRYCERLPAARLALVPDAGHAAHLENPEYFGTLARDFFARCEERD